MIHIAIMGFGVVGSGIAEALTRNRSLIERRTGASFDIRRVLDLRDFPDSPFAPLVTHDFRDILDDPSVTLVAEAMGGAHPAREFTLACLEAGKSVVTSNKEVVASFGTELLRAAAARGVSYLFEGAVGGGIPVLRPMREDLAHNRVESIDGILNGTTNYILTRMDAGGTDFASALREAQEQGYAEADPSADTEGLDAARKIAILAALAFGKLIPVERIACEGIASVTQEDMELARSMGYAVKLIGHASRAADGRILAMVSPRLVPASSPLHGVNGVFNGIAVRGDLVGDVMFYGPGAGKLPTASAVVSDMTDIMARAPAPVPHPLWEDADDGDVAPLGDCICRHLLVLDAPDGSALDAASLFGGTTRPRRTSRGLALLTDPMSESEVLSRVARAGCPLRRRLRAL